MKHSPHSPKAANAFTLIELLVVIAIIAILIGLLFPAFSAVRESTKKTVAKNDETQIVTAVKAYYVEYGKYPVSSSGTPTDAYFGEGTAPAGSVKSPNGNADLFDVLTNNTASAINGGTGGKVAILNPRQIVFLTIAPVKNPTNPVSGVEPNGGAKSPGAWFDPWGSTYNVLIDSNYDGNITNPYTDTVPPGGAILSQGGVIVWANGKNGATGGGAGQAGTGNFQSEPGTADKYTGSGDMISWQ